MEHTHTHTHTVLQSNIRNSFDVDRQKRYYFAGYFRGLHYTAFWVDHDDFLKGEIEFAIGAALNESSGRGSAHLVACKGHKVCLRVAEGLSNQHYDSTHTKDMMRADDDDGTDDDEWLIHILCGWWENMATYEGNALSVGGCGRVCVSALVCETKRGPIQFLSHWGR